MRANLLAGCKCLELPYSQCGGSNVFEHFYCRCRTARGERSLAERSLQSIVTMMEQNGGASLTGGMTSCCCSCSRFICWCDTCMAGDRVARNSLFSKTNYTVREMPNAAQILFFLSKKTIFSMGPWIPCWPVMLFIQLHHY